MQSSPPVRSNGEIALLLVGLQHSHGSNNSSQSAEGGARRLRGSGEVVTAGRRGRRRNAGAGAGTGASGGGAWGGGRGDGAAGRGAGGGDGGRARDGRRYGDAVGLADLLGVRDSGGLVGGVARPREAAGDRADEGRVAADALRVGATPSVAAAAGKELVRAALLLGDKDR